jgi:hypothetical protein
MNIAPESSKARLFVSVPESINPPYPSRRLSPNNNNNNNDPDRLAD